MRLRAFAHALMGVAAAFDQKAIENSHNDCPKPFEDLLVNGGLPLSHDSDCSQFLITTLIPPKTTLFVTSTVAYLPAIHQVVQTKNANANKATATTTTIIPTKVPPLIQSVIAACEPWHHSSVYSSMYRKACLESGGAVAKFKIMPIETTTVVHVVPKITTKFNLVAYFIHNSSTVYVNVGPDGALYIKQSLEELPSEFVYGPHHEITIGNRLSWVGRGRKHALGAWRPQEIGFSVSQRSGFKKLIVEESSPSLDITSSHIRSLTPSKDVKIGTSGGFIQCGQKICVAEWGIWLLNRIYNSDDENILQKEANEILKSQFTNGDDAPILLLAIPSLRIDPTMKLQQIITNWLKEFYKHHQKDTLANWTELNRVLGNHEAVPSQFKGHDEL